MFEEINAHRQAVQENIEKAFEVGFTGNEDLEKAHQVGDIHPNGKWVWTQLPSGKYDWRVIKKKDSGANANNSSSTGRGNNSVKSSSSEQAVDIVLTNEDYDRVFHRVGLSRQTPFQHNNKSYILKIFGKKLDGSYIISVHNGDTGKMLRGDSNIAVSVRRAFINQLKQEKLRDIERNAKKKPSSKKNPSELETISEVEDYAKSISGVTFKSVKSGWDDKGAKAFELTYPHGGKLVIDFLNNEEYVYELTDSNDKSIISTNSTNETSHTDWSIRLNPDKLVSQRVEVLKTKLTKLKGEETKARNKMIRNYSSFSDKYTYQKASEAVSDMKTKIQKLQSLIGTF